VITLIGPAFSFVKVPALIDLMLQKEIDVDALNVDRTFQKLFQHKHFVWAVVAQFFNVAAQGGTWLISLIMVMKMDSAMKSGLLFCVKYGDDDVRPFCGNILDEIYSAEQIAGRLCIWKYSDVFDYCTKF
jgi:fucose permease